MSDLIERKAAKEAYCKKFCHPGVMCPDSGFCREVDEAFDSVPSVQPERKRGHWIDDYMYQRCSQCGAEYSDLYPDYDETKFCPNCGSDNRGDENWT